MRVLFVCEGNINRSQMAEAFLRRLRPDVEIETAGTLVPPWREGKPLSSIPGGSIETMKDIGYDIGAQVMNHLTKEMVERADRLVLVGPTLGALPPPYFRNDSRLEEWGVPDPGYGAISHEGARDLIREKVDAFAKTLPLP